MSSPQVVIRDPVDGHMYTYDVGTLSWVAWDGSVSLDSGSVTIGTVNQGAAGAVPWKVTENFGIGVYDYIALTYTGDNLTGVVYKLGGAGGATVATLTLAYTGAVLISVTKT